jgi:DNA processing protein
VGVDTAAHLGAMASPEGYTLAVLGSGVLNVYPPENHNMEKGILQRGAFLCEVHPKAKVNSPALVARNRIISGLSEGVIVVETEIDGGAMHAARFAKLQGRKVYVVENDASGNRALLADGAVPISPDLSYLPF